MAPNNTAVAGLLRQAVYYHLDNGSWDNALFFAERLSAQDPRNSESAYLLSLSHLRLGDNRSAYEFSKPLGYRGLHLGCAFVFAQSCLALERFRDGQLALEKSKGLWLHKSNIGKHTATTRAIHPDAAAVNCLLGKLCLGMDDRKRAATYFEDALRTNPLMWDAFTALCDMGLSVRVSNTFRVNDGLVHCFQPDASPDAAETGHLSEQPLPSLKRPLSTSSTLARPVMHDMSDPFDHQPPQPAQQHPLHRSMTAQKASSAAGNAEPSGESDFMARLFGARARDTGGSALSQASDSTATLPGTQQDPPQASMRRKAGMPSIAAGEPGFADTQLSHPPGAPTKIMSRLGASTRRGKLLDGSNGDLSASDHTVSSLLRSTASATNGGTAGSTAPSYTAPTASTYSTTNADRKRNASGHPVVRQTHQEETSVPQRRSARLKSTIGSRTNAGAVTMGAGSTRELKKARPTISKIVRPGSSGSTVGRVVSGNRKPVDDGGMDVDPMEGPRVRDPATMTASQQSSQQQAAVPPAMMAKHAAAEADSAKTEEALRWILELLKKLGNGYMHLSQFQCLDVLQSLGSLPRAHLDTPWVQALMGRAQYELAAYSEAEICFRRVRVMAPTRLEDMEVYSTILWFLKRETDLSFLAHELVDAAWHSPQAWCALGNAWSLAQDHEQALRCFRRATQLNPKFAYAYTLQGHEHVMNEEYDKALTAYRHAVAADRRHYNAYYGIGRVYEKLGNFDKAFAHYHTASVIHPTNAVLVCCIGKVLERQKQIVAALQYFSKATDLAPRAAQTRFRKARALLALGQLQAAQQELMILKDLAPDEAAVHFLLGKLYKTLNDKSAAVRHFTIALSLDPKASQKIKQAIGSLEDDDDGLEDYMVA